MTTEKIKIIAIIGKAGSGKDTIATALVDEYPNTFNNIVSCTTRPMRQGEQEGINYYYLSEDEFAERERNGDMLESTEFNTWHYGTSKKALSNKSVNVGVFNPAGVRSLIKDNDIDLFIFYVRAGDKTRLLRQLNREENPDVKEIIRRFGADESDFGRIDFIPNASIINESKEDIRHAVDMLISNIQDRWDLGNLG